MLEETTEQLIGEYVARAIRSGKSHVEIVADFLDVFSAANLTPEQLETVRGHLLDFLGRSDP